MAAKKRASCYPNYVAATSIHSSQNTWPQERGLTVTQINCPQQTDRHIVPQLSGRKTSRLSVTQKKMAAKSMVNVPKFLATKQVVLLLHK